MSTLLKKVALEGCNGNWAQKRYLPLLAQKAGESELELLAIDVVPEPGDFAAELWHAAKDQNRVCYLNKSRYSEEYQRLTDVDCVFIVAPDQFHCQIAEFWLPRLTPTGNIFIEKPLDASVQSALSLKEKIGKDKVIYAFDHYLARAEPFVRDKAKYIKRIGSIKRIKFHILEPFSIPPNRVKALDKGMIFDLFSHVLALVAGVTNSSTTAFLSRVKLDQVKAAKYINCPISGESFAWIKFSIDDIPITAAVGKCVATSEDKLMVLYGTTGRIELDFIKDRFFITDSQGTQQGRLNPNHVESFLEFILHNRMPLLSAPGVLTFDTALEILRILEESKKRIRKMPLYHCKTSLEDILRSLG